MSFEIDPKAPKHIVRRDFLRRLSAASAAALACSAPRALSAEQHVPVAQPISTMPAF
ncbi:MAG: twin-arginine translocation signal domain-containing protein [Planctomycetaceae bacterium]